MPRTEVTTPGTYAFVALVNVEPHADQDRPTHWFSRSSPAPACSTVTADPSRASAPTDAGGDGGAHLTVPVMAALGIEFWCCGRRRSGSRLRQASPASPDAPRSLPVVVGLFRRHRPRGGGDVCHQSGAQPLLSPRSARSDDSGGEHGRGASRDSTEPYHARDLSASWPSCPQPQDRVVQLATSTCEWEQRRPGREARFRKQVRFLRSASRTCVGLLALSNITVLLVPATLTGPVHRRRP